jgi:hypothetical protein
MNPDDNFTIAIHEAGHSVAASHFRIAAYPEITPGGESRLTGAIDPKHAGVCHLDDGLVTNFQDAALCWAGPLSECLYGTPPSWTPPFKPSRLMLRDWHGMMMQQIKQFSDGDRVGILGYRDTWRSCKSAFKIVRKNKARIIRLAKALAGRNTTPSVPMPATFPATFAQFLYFNVPCGSPEETFRAFLHAQAEKTFAASQFALDTAQQKDAAEKWTTGRMEQLKAGGFTTADEWQSTARAIKAWSTAKAKNSTAQAT